MSIRSSRRLTPGPSQSILLLRACSNSRRLTPCPNSCSSNGISTRPRGVCSCFDRCTGADCSLRTFPFGRIAWADAATDTDSAHHTPECSKRGIFDRGRGYAFAIMVCSNARRVSDLSVQMNNVRVYFGKALARKYLCTRRLGKLTICDEGYSGYECSRLRRR
ncbi:hypothetical protein ACHAW6_003926 [Cyclotella cf. meneghiniana]